MSSSQPGHRTSSPDIVTDPSGRPSSLGLPAVSKKPLDAPNANATAKLAPLSASSAAAAVSPATPTSPPKILGHTASHEAAALKDYMARHSVEPPAPEPPKPKIEVPPALPSTKMTVPVAALTVPMTSKLPAAIEPESSRPIPPSVEPTVFQWMVMIALVALAIYLFRHFAS